MKKVIYFIFINILLFNTIFAATKAIDNNARQITLFVYTLISERYQLRNDTLKINIDKNLIKRIKTKKLNIKFPWHVSYLDNFIIQRKELKKNSSKIYCIYYIKSALGGELKIDANILYTINNNVVTIKKVNLDVQIIKKPCNNIKELYEQLKNKRKELFKLAKKNAWHVYFTIGIEYRDNAALLPDDEDKPDDIEAKGDSLLTYSLGGNYDFYTIGKHKFTAGLYYTGIRHKELKSFDGDSVTGTVGWKFTEPRQYQLRTTVAFSHSWYGHDNYSNNFSITPGVSYCWNNWTWTDFDYSYSRPVYLNNPPSEADRSGQYHFFSLGQKFRHNSLLIDGKNTYWGITTIYYISNTEGSDYDSHAYGVSLRIIQEFAWGITVSTSLARLKNNFEHVNSRSDDNSRRHDTRDSLFLRVSKKFKPWLYGYIGYRYLKNNSNIEDYEYHTNNYSIGIGVEF